MTSDETSSANSYLFDSESAAEMARLINFDRITTSTMGGPLAEQTDPAHFHSVLDIACGPGGWCLDLAYANPDMDISGIDISHTMTDYARARARSQGLSNASFEVMDVTQPLAFSDQSFDLINGRFLVGFLLKEQWPQLIKECVRLLRPGGVLRLTETDAFGITNGPANERLNALFMQMAHQAGYGFSVDGRSFGITVMLEPLLRQAGLKHIQHKAHIFSFPAGTQNWSEWRDNAIVAFLQVGTLLVQFGVISQEESDNLLQQVSIEMVGKEFAGIWPYITVWGTKL